MDQVVDHRTRPFYWIDKCIPTQYARLIKAQGIALYNALALHADRNQEARVSLDTLCNESGIETREAVLKYLALLEQHGLIAIIRHRGQRGNIYQLLDVVANPGATRPNKPSAPPAQTAPSLNSHKPVNQAVDKSAESVDKSTGIVGCTDNRPNELSATPTVIVGYTDNSDDSIVGYTDNSSPELSATPTQTRQKTRQKTRQDNPDDDDPRAREAPRSSSSLSLSALEDQFGTETVREAFLTAAAAGKTGSLPYAAGILRNWAREGTGPPASERINPYASAPDPHRVLREEYGDDVFEDALQVVIAGSRPVEELGNIAADLAGDPARWVETRAGWQREGAP